MSRWSDLQDWLTSQGKANGTFTVHEYAVKANLSTPVASAGIAAYQDAQRRTTWKWKEDENGTPYRVPVDTTEYVIYRAPGTRTSSSIWHVGKRTNDVSRLVISHVDDERSRILQAIQPSLERLARINPRAEKHVRLMVDSFLAAHAVNLENLVVQANTLSAAVKIAQNSADGEGEN